MNEDLDKEQQFLDEKLKNTFIIRENYNIEKFFKQDNLDTSFVPGGVGIRSEIFRNKEKNFFSNSSFRNLFTHFCISKPSQSKSTELSKNEKAALVSIRKILQRGDMSFLSPEIESELLKKYGHLYTNEQNKGDVCPILEKEPIDIKTQLIDWTGELKTSPDTILSYENNNFDSGVEKKFFEYCKKNFPHSIKWLHSQPKKEYFVEKSYKEEINANHERGSDFLYAPPWQKPVIIEILGPHWFPDGDTSLPTLASVKFNELKSRFNDELVDVYGVPVSQVDIEDGEDFNVVKELLTPPKESPDKKITEFLNTLWSIGAFQQLMPELLEYEKLHRKKVWNIEINTFSGLVGFEYFLNFLHAISQIWSCEKLVPERVNFYSEGNGKPKSYKINEKGKYKKVTLENEATKKDLSLYIDHEKSYLEKYPSINAFFVRKSTLPFSLTNKIGRVRKPKIEIDDSHKIYLEEVLKYIFGKTKFRDVQFEAIRRVLEDKNSLVLLPTGFGKSMIYQLSSFILPGVSIIISPTVALIKNQQKNLELNSITRGVGITGDYDHAKKALLYNDISNGDIFMILCSPERLLIPEFNDSMKQAVENFGLSLNTIDEAHCISEWGQEFRTSYLGIGKRLEELSDRKTPLLALTGTASLKVRLDIVFNCNLQETDILQTENFKRNELNFGVVHNQQPTERGNLLKDVFEENITEFFDKKLLDFFKTQERETDNNLILIFAPYKKDLLNLRKVLEKWFKDKELDNPGIEIMYGSKPIRKSLFKELRAGDDQSAYKTKTTEEFRSGKVKILIATKAFGMGIDIPNIRAVIHYGIPSSLMSWYQEAGRAGRDQENSMCHTIFTEEPNIDANELFFKHNPDVLDEKKEVIKNSDINVHLRFYYQGFPGIYEEVLYLVDFLRKFNEQYNYEPWKVGRNATLPFFANIEEIDPDEKLDEEAEIQAEEAEWEAETTNTFIDKTIYRLMICGVFKTWHKDYSQKQYIFDLNTLKDIIKFEELESWLNQRLHTTTRGFIQKVKVIAQNINEKKYQEVINEFVHAFSDSNSEDTSGEKFFDFENLRSLDKVIIKPPNAASIKKIENLKKVIKLKPGFTEEQRESLEKIFEKEWFSNELCGEIKDYIEGKGRHNNRGFTRFTKSNKTQKTTEKQKEAVENIINTTKSSGFKKRYGNKKIKTQLDMDWFMLEKIIYEQGVDGSYNTKMKIQKEIKKYEKKASGFDALIICVFTFLLKATYDSIGYQKRDNHLQVYRFAKDNKSNEEIQTAFNNFFGDSDPVFAEELRDRLIKRDISASEEATVEDWINALQKVTNLEKVGGDLVNVKGSVGEQFGLWYIGYLYVLIMLEKDQDYVIRHLEDYAEYHKDVLFQLTEFLVKYGYELGNISYVSLLLSWMESVREKLDFNDLLGKNNLLNYQAFKGEHIKNILDSDNRDNDSLTLLNHSLLSEIKELKKRGLFNSMT
tara:strand:+ start:1153 stop:5520 length:4368 start_codon:yes stop_codon:yes gene_type:complete